jgi:fatty-acyl-CoA synthase
MARGLLETRTPDREQLGSLRALVVGGAVSTPQLAQQVETRLGATFVGSYGLTETSPVLTLATLLPEMDHWSAEQRLVQQSSAGRPTPAARLRVVDSSGAPVAQDGTSVGEVQVAGDLVMQGYWRLPDETAAVYRDGWLHTGDLATIDRWGYLRIVDRIKALINCGGEMVAPAEVQQVLMLHPAVREAAVIGVPHPRWGQVPEARVVLEPGHSVTDLALRRHCAAHLSTYKVPRKIRFLSRLPHTATGKLARSRIR